MNYELRHRRIIKSNDMNNKQHNVTYIYRKGRNKVVRRDVSTVEIDSNVTSIEDYTFRNWTSLSSISLPSTITSLGSGVFRNCPSLTSVTLPSTITALGDYVFSACPSLTSITLPSTITDLGKGIFKDCSKLTSVTLPSKITSLGAHFFLRCSSLKEVNLPASITTLGYGVFEGCSSLTSITLPPRITTLGYHIFHGCSSLTSATLSPKMTTLGYHIFHGCSSLTSVNLPPNLTSISIRTFEGCSNLTTIKASSFSITTFNDNPEVLKEVLLDAGFSPFNPDDILCGRSKRQNRVMYYDIKAWTRTRGKDGRLPLCTAASRSLKWADMRKVFASNMPALYEDDGLTGLPLFMLSAVGPASDIESIYNLLKEDPSAISLMKEGEKRFSSSNTRKRRDDCIEDSKVKLPKL